MANPNIATATNIFGRTIGMAVTTSTQNLTGTVPLNRIYKINSLIIANISGTAAADVNVTLLDSSAGTSYNLAYTITVPADSTLVVISKDTQIYIEEQDNINITCSANSTLHAIVSFEEIYA